MRKKRSGIQAAILSTAVLMMLTGCGSKSERDQAQEYYQNELELDEKDANELADAFYGDGTSDSQNTTAEETTKEYEHFDADPGWKDISPQDYAIQIDDVLYRVWQSPDEFIKQVEGSSVDYTYEYNPDKLVSGKEYETIYVYRDGKRWIEATAFNFSDETTSLSECMVVNVNVGTYSPYSSDAKEYAYFIDGRSYEDIMSMSYSDVKKLSEDIFEDYEMSEGDNIDDKTKLDIIYQKGDITNEITDYMGYVITWGRYYSFSIDKETSQMSSFYSNGSGFSGHRKLQ